MLPDKRELNASPPAAPFDEVGGLLPILGEAAAGVEAADEDVGAIWTDVK